MKTNLALSVTKPCSENWDNFSIALNDKFCSSCSKVVIDFTKMSDHEIMNFFKDKPSNLCGRFYRDQLKIYNNDPLRINPGLTLLKAGLLSLLFLLVSKQTSAQNTPTKPKTEITQPQVQSMQQGQPMVKPQIAKGVVLTGYGDPLPGANINLKGTMIGIAADQEGRFEFPQKVKEGDVLVFSFIGFTTKELVIPKKVTDELQVSMVCDITILGEVAVNDVYVQRQSGFGRLWTKVKGMF